MYFTHNCPYCMKAFTVYAANNYTASEQLYDIIKKHLIDYNEDHKEYEMDDGKATDSKEILQQMSESSDKPQGSY